MLRFFSRDNFLKDIIFGAFVILCLIFSFKNVDIAIMLFISLVFACSLNPIVDKLEKKMPRTTATIIVLFGALTILGALLGFIFVLGAYQVNELIKEFPNYINGLEDVIQNNRLLQNFGITKIDTESIFSNIATSAEGVIEQILLFVRGMGSGLVYCLTGIIFCFFFLQDKKSIKKTVLSYFPENIKTQTEGIMNDIGNKIGGYVFAQTVAVLSVFVVNAIGLLIFNVPYAIFIAVITAVFDIVPVIGPFVAIIISLIAVYDFGVKAVVITLIVTCLAQIIENNVVRPFAFSKLMNLHPIIIFLSLILGGKYFGFVGVLFGPAMAATICVLLNELYVRNIK